MDNAGSFQAEPTFWTTMMPKDPDTPLISDDAYDFGKSSDPSEQERL
jgi:hypothetical protein